MLNIAEKIFKPSIRGRLWRNFILIILLILVCTLVDFGFYYNKATNWLAWKTNNYLKLPHVKEIPFRLGLDLQGGTHLVYRADVSQVPEGEVDSAMEGVRDVIERRVNAFGVSEPLVQISKSGGEERLIVELAGVKDVNAAIKMIGETPILEFKEESNDINDLTPDQREILEGYNKKAEERAQDLLGKLISGGDFEALAKEYNEDSDTKDTNGELGWVTEKDYPEIVNIAKKLKKGKFNTDLEKTSKGYEFVLLEDKRIKTNPFNENEKEKEVKAAHILICHKDSEGCHSDLSKDEAYQKIKQIQKEVTPANFKELAKKYSDEPGAKETGGELGWFGRGVMVKPFEDTVFSQKVGTISYIVETKFGYHLIYKEDERDVWEYKIRHILIKTANPKEFFNKQGNWKNTELTGKNLKRAIVQFNPNDGSPEVALQFDNEGAKMFEEITARNIGKKIAIFLDGYLISAPVVNEKISGGKAVISGNFTIQEAKLLAQRLNAGALPVPIKLISQQTVGASLGRKSLDYSLKAGIIGLALVALFMIIYYRLPGLLAVFSLIFYGILILAIFKLWPVTLTLSGLAGLILSIGMAVDANVLIFERLREELEAGKPLSRAIEEAFKRAWPSIRDGNFSTLITCFILIQFSTSIVKGFAITLSLGVIISMFSAIIITKNLFNLVAGDWLEKRRWLM